MWHDRHIERHIEGQTFWLYDDQCPPGSGRKNDTLFNKKIQYFMNHTILDHLKENLHTQVCKNSGMQVFRYAGMHASMQLWDHASK